MGRVLFSTQKHLWLFFAESVSVWATEDENVFGSGRLQREHYAPDSAKLDFSTIFDFFGVFHTQVKFLTELSAGIAPLLRG